jgi:hypothetical protein
VADLKYAFNENIEVGVGYKFLVIAGYNFLMVIGHLLQCRSQSVGESDAKLTTAEYKHLVHDQLAKEGHAGPELSKLVELLREAVKDRLVFLTGLTDGHVGFEIRSLQEFMAADYIADATHARPGEHEKMVKESLRAISTNTYWRNVYLFVAGRIFAKERHLREFITGVCQEANESIEDPAAVEVLAGSQLALDLLEDGSARSQPNVVKVLTRIAVRILDIPQSSLHTKLAAQCSSNTESILKEELEKRLASKNYDTWLWSETRLRVKTSRPCGQQ